MKNEQTIENNIVDTYKDNNTGFLELIKGDTSKKVIQQVAYFFMGILSTRATIFGGYAPFGVAFVASCPFSNILAVTFGSILGCLFPTSVTNDIRYITTILAVGALRWVLNDLVALREHPLFAPLISALPLAVTGIILSLVTNTYYSATIVMILTETMIAASAAFFITATIKIFYGTHGITSLSPQQVACVTLCGCIILLALSGILIGPVSVGHILAVLAILFCTSFGGVAGGAISGIAAGAVLSLCSTNITYISGAFAFGGLISGMFSRLGKFAIVISFIIANGIMAIQTGDSSAVVSNAYEVAIATIIFMLIPHTISSKIGRVFDPSIGTYNVDGMRRTVIMRMDFASKTLNDITSCIDKISNKLKNVGISDIESIYMNTSENICKKCKLKLVCWERDYEDTMNIFNDITLKLQNNGEIRKEDFPARVSRRCPNLNDIADDINNSYRSFMANSNSEQRIGEIRSVVNNQIGSMSDIVTDFTKELKLYDRFDYITSEQISTLLKENQIDLKEVSCRIDKYDRMIIEIQVRKKDARKLLKKEIIKTIERICDRKLDIPCISTTPYICKMQISEKANLEVEIGVKQHTCENGRLCGDSYTYFNDGFGRIVVILSDGMGSGGRAAVDGAMATGIISKLTKSGISFKCALRIVNSALIVKSGEESLATIDVIIIDLFTGKVEFKKSGAATTFIKHNGRVSKLDLPSLPAGILPDIEFAKKEMHLANGDCILMVSDGALFSGSEWIESEVAKWEDQSEKDFANKIVEQAQFRRDDGHDDDITAIAIKIYY